MSGVKMDRRAFLRGLALLPLVSVLPPWVCAFEGAEVSSTGQQDGAFAAGLKKSKPDGEGEPGVIHQLGVFRGRTADSIVEISHDVHSIVPSRVDPQTLILVSKEQKVGSIYNRASKRLVTFNAKEGNILSGHGTFTPQSDFFITSETNEAQSTGELIVRHSQTGAVVGTLNSGGIYPHEMTFVRSGRELLVANGGLHRGGANMTILSFPSGAIIKTFPTPDLNAGPRHVAATSGEEVIVGSWNRLSAEDEKQRDRPRPEEAKAMILGLESDGELSEIQIPQKSRAEFPHHVTQYLSVGFHSMTKLGVLTATGAGAIIVVEPDKRTVRKVIPHADAAGVCDVGDGRHMALSLAGGKLAYLDMFSLELSVAFALEESTRFNSHLTAIFA